MVGWGRKSKFSPSRSKFSPRFSTYVFAKVLYPAAPGRGQRQAGAGHLIRDGAPRTRERSPLTGGPGVAWPAQPRSADSPSLGRAWPILAGRARPSSAPAGQPGRPLTNQPWPSRPVNPDRPACPAQPDSETGPGGRSWHMVRPIVDATPNGCFHEPVVRGFHFSVFQKMCFFPSATRST